MPRILLLDDDIAEISAVKRVLARLGHQPVLATNASDALASITQGKPALLIASATCESGDALRLARGLNDDLDTAGIPLLVLGDATDLPTGARRLARPIDPEQLTAEVNQALSPKAETPKAPAAPMHPPAAAAPQGRPRPRPSPAPAPTTAEPPPAKEDARAAARAPEASPETRPPAPQANAAASRRAAAEALRARAEELRRRALGAGAREAVPPPPPPAPAARAKVPEPGPDAHAATFLEPPASPPPPPPEVTSEEAHEKKLAAAQEARQEAADLALRALEEEASAHVAEVMRSRSSPGSQIDPSASTLAAEAVESARRSEDERRLREAIEKAKHEAFEAARSELEARAREEAARVAKLQAEADARARDEAHAHEEAIAVAQKESGELLRREAEAKRLTSEAEAQTKAEGELRQKAEAELTRLRTQLVEERRKAEERIASVMQRAEAEEKAAEELRRMAEDEDRRREEEAEESREKEEQTLRSSFESLKAEMEVLRKKQEEDAQKRSLAEAAFERAEAARREEATRQEEQAARDEELRRREQALREEEFRRQEQTLRDELLHLKEEVLHAEQARRFEQEKRAQEPLPKGPAPESRGAATYEPSLFDRPDFFAPFDGADAELEPSPLAPPDPNEEAARRRVAALRTEPPEPEEPATFAMPAIAPTHPPKAPLEPRPADPEEPPRAIPAPVLQLRAGELSELPAPRLFALAARAGLSGRLDFRGEASRSLWFEDGQVVGAQSAEPYERVEEVALRLGLITRDQHRRMAQAASTLASRRAALLLLERGFLKASELTGLVRRRTEEVVFGVFAEQEGRFRWSGSPVPPEERTTLERSTLALAVEGVRRRWLAPRLEALLGGPATLLVPVPGGPSPAELGLSPEERRLAALADGLRTLDELVQTSPLDALSTRQVLAALVLVSSLTVRLVQAGRPAAQASAAIDLARVKDKLEQVRRADYFSVLGVGRHGTPHEVREAADRLKGEFDPRRFAGVVEEGLPARLAEILQVLQDAREVLSDDRLREEYLRGLGDAD